MATAIAEAEAGLAEGDIPIGSVLVHQGRIIGRGPDRRVQRYLVRRNGRARKLGAVAGVGVGRRQVPVPNPATGRQGAFLAFYVVRHVKGLRLPPWLWGSERSNGPFPPIGQRSNVPSSNGFQLNHRARIS
jgi:hypothetical protein